jgi:hypothetical protein
LVKAIHRELGAISSNVDLLCRTIENMIIQNNLLRHENTQLNLTVLYEAGRRKGVKAPGILGKELQFGQFWVPVKLAIRRDEIKTKEEQERSKKQLVEEKKQQEADNHQIRDQLYRERVEFDKKERERKKAQKDAKRERKGHERELNKVLKTIQNRLQLSRSVQLL